MKKITKRWIFALGMIIGVVLSVVTVVAGSVSVFSTPLWQKVLLFPGFLAGLLFYKYCNSWLPGAEDAALFIGILSVGVSYGFVAMGLWRWVRWVNRSSTTK
jgi:hypothetical protein